MRGKNVLRMIARPKFQDHPRRCGENVFRDQLGKNLMGSPPQVRGKLPTFLHCITVLQDHPRRCGENAGTEHYSRHQPGSPPQVRGKRNLCRTSASSQRITPAGAGKTAACSAGLTKRQDHPRRCGENARSILSSTHSRGSPPRMRGKRFLTATQATSI